MPFGFSCLCNYSGSTVLLLEVIAHYILLFTFGQFLEVNRGNFIIGLWETKFNITLRGGLKAVLISEKWTWCLMENEGKIIMIQQTWQTGPPWKKCMHSKREWIKNMQDYIKMSKKTCCRCWETMTSGLGEAVTCSAWSPMGEVFPLKFCWFGPFPNYDQNYSDANMSKTISMELLCHSERLK